MQFGGELDHSTYSAATDAYMCGRARAVSMATAASSCAITRRRCSGCVDEKIAGGPDSRLYLSCYCDAKWPTLPHPVQSRIVSSTGFIAHNDFARITVRDVSNWFLTSQSNWKLANTVLIGLRYNYDWHVFCHVLVRMLLWCNIVSPLHTGATPGFTDVRFPDRKRRFPDVRFPNKTFPE